MGIPRGNGLKALMIGRNGSARKQYVFLRGRGDAVPEILSLYQAFDKMPERITKTQESLLKIVDKNI